MGKGVKHEDRTQHTGSLLFCLCLGLAAILCLAAMASERQITGRYTLQSANGNKLPAVVAENKETNYQLEVTRGWIEFGVDRTFAWLTAYRMTERGVVRASESGGNGDYSVSGKVVSLKPEGSSSVLEGILSNDTLVLQADARLVYRKEDAGK